MGNKNLLYVVIDAGKANYDISAITSALHGVGEVRAFGSGFFVMLNAGKTATDLETALGGIGGSLTADAYAIQVLDRNASVLPAQITTWINQVTKAA